MVVGNTSCLSTHTKNFKLYSIHICKIGSRVASHKFSKRKQFRVSQHARFEPHPYIPATYSTSWSGITDMDNCITAIHFVRNKLHILSAINLCTSEEMITLREIAPVLHKNWQYSTPWKIIPGTFTLWTGVLCVVTMLGMQFRTTIPFRCHYEVFMASKTKHCHVCSTHLHCTWKLWDGIDLNLGETMEQSTRLHWLFSQQNVLLAVRALFDHLH